MVTIISFLSYLRSIRGTPGHSSIDEGISAPFRLVAEIAKYPPTYVRKIFGAGRSAERFDANHAASAEKVVFVTISPAFIGCPAIAPEKSL